jgi:flagellar biosynthesis protein FlhF
MKLKRFIAPDMRQALRLVREEQGPDAVILSNQRVDGGIEIIAAVDYDPVLARHMLGGASMRSSSRTRKKRRRSGKRSRRRREPSPRRAPSPSLSRSRRRPRASP